MMDGSRFWFRVPGSGFLVHQLPATIVHCLSSVVRYNAAMEIDLLTDDVGAYYQEEFVDLALTGGWVRSKEFEDCRFVRCRFVECGFNECSFMECRFEGCLFSNVQIPGCSVIDTGFVECKLVGVDWTEGAKLNLRGIQFSGCSLEFCVFSGLKLKGLKMLRCECKEADFRETDLTDGDFGGTNFEKSVFSRTNLTNANFAGARNYWIDPRDNVVKKAKFSLPEAVSLLRIFEVVIVDGE